MAGAVRPAFLKGIFYEKMDDDAAHCVQLSGDDFCGGSAIDAAFFLGGRQRHSPD